MAKRQRRGADSLPFTGLNHGGLNDVHRLEPQSSTEGKTGLRRGKGNVPKTPRGNFRLRSAHNAWLFGGRKNGSESQKEAWGEILSQGWIGNSVNLLFGAETPFAP